MKRVGLVWALIAVFLLACAPAVAPTRLTVATPTPAPTKAPTASQQLYADSENLGSFAPSDSFTITLPALGTAYIRLSAASA